MCIRDRPLIPGPRPSTLQLHTPTVAHVVNCGFENNWMWNTIARGAILVWQRASLLAPVPSLRPLRQQCALSHYQPTTSSSPPPSPWAWPPS
eukprot:9073876-Alexandrium_andersonii.AAC.1